MNISSDLVSLLSGVRNAKDDQLAQQVYNRMKELFPYSEELFTVGLTLLENTYSLTGNIEKAIEIRSELTQSGLKKIPGLSWTVINGQIFVSFQYSQLYMTNYD